MRGNTRRCQAENPLIALSSFLEPALIHVPRTRIERLVAESSPITSDTARRLGKVFATSPAFWMNLQTTFDLTFKGLQAPNLKVLSPNFLPLPPPFNRIPDVAPCSAVSRQKGSSADGRTFGLAARGVEARSWAV
jgi:antitoxin HigA-1